jgi:hypothetical protein
MKQGTARALALAAIVGQWLFTVDWLVAPLWQDHYRPIDQAVSEMGGLTANLPWLMNAGFLVWGVSILAGAAALRRVLPGSRWRPLIVGSLALAAGAMMLVAFTRVDCSATVNRACYDAWVAGNASWHSYVHDWAAFAFGVFMAGSALAVAGFLYSVREPVIASVPAIGGAVGMAWQLMGVFGDPRFAPHGHYGLYQRITILAASGWIVLLAAAVLSQLEERRVRQPEWTSAAPPRWSAGRPTRPSA